MSRQIVGHWLTGETTESSSDFIDKNKQDFTPGELNLIHKLKK